MNHDPIYCIRDRRILSMLMNIYRERLDRGGSIDDFFGLVYCHFCRSVWHMSLTQYDIRLHPSFSEYLSMILNCEKWCLKYLSECAYISLVEKYKKMEGLRDGYTYWLDWNYEKVRSQQ